MALIRPRTDADFEPLSDVLRETHAKTGYPMEELDDARAFILNESATLIQAWVAVWNGEIVGHIAINEPTSTCPAVTTWRAQGNNERVAVVSRLFVQPSATGSARGVSRGLMDAVTKWSQDNETRLIVYVVVLSAIRVLLADDLAAKHGYVNYGESVFHSPDGPKRALCYVQPLHSLYPHLSPQSSVRPLDQRLGFGFGHFSMMSLRSAIWRAWCDPKRKLLVHLHRCCTS